MAVALFDTTTPLAPLRQQIIERLTAVVNGGRYVLGPEVQGFEREFAQYLGVVHVVGVANGTDALTIALRAAGVGPGDEVVVPSFTFYASAEAIIPTGATPVFCDVDEETANVTAETVSAALTPRTKAVVAVDLFGNPAPIAEIRERTGLPVIEDAAQAAGARVAGRHAGSLGTVATFSFFPSKNLPCFGDGGAIATDDSQIADRARVLRSHGSRDKTIFEHVGYNSRLDELQAAVLRVLLPYLDEWAAGRRAAAANYEAAGLGEHVTLPASGPGNEPAWHLYVVRHPDAEHLCSALERAGVEARGYYRTPVHRQPAMARWGAGVELPATEQLARTNLAIPMSPVLTSEQAREVISAIAGALASMHATPAGSASASPPSGG
ncbi:MAG: DegT/DnrJ/EryC1/StrS family aminotransferase [Actinobacteria bacterium]|nr:MAG: DegT/DnrJ/EryC1/StrS family aminotransferase [Actinomycetota bacterium]